MQRLNRFKPSANVGWVWDFSWTSWTFGFWWDKGLRTRIGFDLGPLTIMYKDRW